MTRQLEHEGFGTPFGKWIRQNCKSSTGNDEALVVSNLDYVLYDYRTKHLMLLEEKFGLYTPLAIGQLNVFKQLDECLRRSMLWQNDHQISSGEGQPPAPDPKFRLKYWGFFVLNLEGGLPHDGMLLNGEAITIEQLIRHLNFHEQVVGPMF